MSLADIKKKIEADASGEAQEILKKAQKQADQIFQKADKEISEMKVSYEDRFEAERPEILRRRNIVANLDVKKIALGAKQELVGEVFAKALDKLNASPSAKYLSFTEKLLSEAIVTGDEEVMVGKGEKKITTSWLKSYNEKNKTNLTISPEKADISGGFVLNRGKVSENASFGMLLRALRDDLEADVVKRLFSE